MSQKSVGRRGALPPGPSLEERVHAVYRDLALIHAACQNDPDHVHVDYDDLIDAVSMAALRAAETLEPLRHAPGEIANWTPKPAVTGGAR
jgi:hypothetical protein